MDLGTIVRDYWGVIVVLVGAVLNQIRVEVKVASRLEELTREDSRMDESIKTLLTRMSSQEKIGSELDKQMSNIQNSLTYITDNIKELKTDVKGLRGDLQGA